MYPEPLAPSLSGLAAAGPPSIADVARSLGPDGLLRADLIDAAVARVAACCRDPARALGTARGLAEAREPAGDRRLQGAGRAERARGAGRARRSAARGGRLRREPRPRGRLGRAAPAARRDHRRARRCAGDEGARLPCARRARAARRAAASTSAWRARGCWRARRAPACCTPSTIPR